MPAAAYLAAGFVPSFFPPPAAQPGRHLFKLFGMEHRVFDWEPIAHFTHTGRLLSPLFTS